MSSNSTRGPGQPDYNAVDMNHVPYTESNPVELPKTIIQTAEVKLPNGAFITVYKMPDKLDDTAMYMKYLSELVDSCAQFLINGCIAILTFMSFQGGFAQNISNSFGPKVLDTINKMTDLAKAQMRDRPQQQAV